MLTGAERRRHQRRNEPLVQRLFAFSRQQVRQFEDVFAAQFPVTRPAKRLSPISAAALSGSMTICWLISRRCLTRIKGPVLQPEIPVFLNDLLAMEDFSGGMDTNDGRPPLAYLVGGWLPQAPLYPGALSVLDTIPCEYRWNTRAILMDPSEAQGVISKIGQKWKFQPARV